jgi:hypothetical protein
VLSSKPVEALTLAEDVKLALNWYLRKLYLEELAAFHIRQVDFARKSGIPASRLTVLERDAAGSGIEMVIGFARYYGVTPGKLLDEAVTWWESGGREKVAEYRVRLGEERRRPKKRKSTSSEFPSPFRLLSAKHRKDTGSGET